MKTFNTLPELLAALPRSTNDLLNFDGQAFYTWQSENTQSGGYARSGSDARDRFNRCHEAAEQGADGSTHAENIDDFRDYANNLFRDFQRAVNRLELSDEESDRADAEIESAENQVAADIDQCEEFHAKQGTLNQQVG